MKLLILFLLSTIVSAQDISDDPARPIIGKSGQIFTIKFTPRAKLMQVSLVERPLVSIDPNQLIVVGKVYPTNGKSKTLRLKMAGQNLEILDPVDDTSTLEFQVEEKMTKRKETIIVKPAGKP